MPSSAKFSCGWPVVSGVVETGLGAQNIPPAARTSRRGSSRDVAPQAWDVPASRRGGVRRDPRWVRGLGPPLRGGYCAQQELSAPGASLQLRALEQGFTGCKLIAQGTWALRWPRRQLCECSRSYRSLSGVLLLLQALQVPPGALASSLLCPAPCLHGQLGQGRAGDARFAGFSQGKVWVAFSSGVGFR